MNKVLIIGSPNSGKSLLFNRLTGLNQKVANFPGVTVEVHSGKSKNGTLEYVDFPGVYSVNALTEDERVAIRAIESELSNHQIHVILCVLDSTRLERSLLYGLQLLKRVSPHGHKMVFVANMLDELKTNHLKFDAAGLSKALGCPVIQVSARSQEGLPELEKVIEKKDFSHETIKEIMEKDDSELADLAHQMARNFGAKGDVLLKTQYKFDRFLLSSFWGYLSFFVIMYVLFQSIFSWAHPLMDGIESLISHTSKWVVGLLPPGIVADFVKDAVFGGFGAFLVFVPQIFILTFIVGFLEDSGYLARAAVLCHRPLHFFGLTGKSFVPMLSGYACAIPALYAARTIDSPKRRFLTYMAIPLMACSARLPVYGLLISAIIPNKTILFGLLGLQGFAFFSIYLFGLVTALLATGLISRINFRKGSKGPLDDDAPFVLEMPPYRLPLWKTLLRHSWEKSKSFLTRAGGIIFMITIVVWFLGYMPNHGTDLGASWLGRMGSWMEPIVHPFGLDWKYAVAILTSFLAREVFVGTMGTLFGIEGAENNASGLIEQLQASGLTLASGLALLAFYAIAMQCVATLAVMKKESGSFKFPARVFIAYTILAYGAAIFVYQLTKVITG